MLKTYLGPVEDESALHYLRPETAQGIFVNFVNVHDDRAQEAAVRHRARSARASATRSRPGNFIFRTREFEQMEMEFFVEPGTDEEWHQYWIDERTRWYVDLGIDPDNLRHYEHPKEKLSHYSKRTVDIEYRFGFAGQRVGRARGHRQPHRLRPHDALEALRRGPVLLRPGHRRALDRRTSSSRRPGLGPVDDGVPVDAYAEDEAPNTKGGVDKRIVLRLDPRLAPVKVAVLPLSRNADLSPEARDLAADAAPHWNVDFDDAGRDRPPLPPPGRDRHAVLRHGRLRHASTDHAVTVRERDSMAQERVALDQVQAYLAARLPGC